MRYTTVVIDDHVDSMFVVKVNSLGTKTVRLCDLRILTAQYHCWADFLAVFLLSARQPKKLDPVVVFTC